MPSQLRGSKRTYSQLDSDDDLHITRSQPAPRPAASQRQTTLSFSQPAPSPAPIPSPALSQTSSIHPSESVSFTSNTIQRIPAKQRIYFAVDCSRFKELNGFRVKARTMRSIGNKSRISWIYLHGMELEKKDKDKWIKHWLCKQCFDEGSPKPMPASSTTSCKLAGASSVGQAQTIMEVQ